MILNNLCVFSHLHTWVGTKEHYATAIFVILISTVGHLLSAYTDIIANYTIPCI